MVSVEQWLVMGALGVFSVLFGALPYILLSKLKTDVFNDIAYHQFLTLLSCIGGGVLMSTTLAHMLPENRLTFQENQFVKDTFNGHFPIAEILILVGFLIIYFLEEIAYFIMVSTGTGVVGHGHSHDSHHHQNEESSISKIKNKDSSEDQVAKRSTSLTSPISGVQPSLLSIHASSRNSIQLHIAPNLSTSVESNTNSQAKLHSSSINLSIDGDEDEGQTRTSQLSSLLALIALSFHSVMEGIAIGIQNSSNVWLLFGAIASHKFVISFCMGMELCTSKARPMIYIGSILLFAFLSPFGIFIGSFLTSETVTKSFSVGVLEAFAAGTLLYVVFFEILNRERERKNTVLSSARYTGFLQFAGVVIGVVAMVCLMSLIDHGHSHSEGGHEHEHDHKLNSNDLNR